MNNQADRSQVPGVTRRQFLTGAAATVAALQLPENQLLRPLLNLAPAKGPADDVVHVALYASAAAPSKRRRSWPASPRSTASSSP